MSRFVDICMTCRRPFQVPRYGFPVECAVCIAGGATNERATRRDGAICAAKHRAALVRTGLQTKGEG